MAESGKNHLFRETEENHVVSIRNDPIFQPISQMHLQQYKKYCNHIWNFQYLLCPIRNSGIWWMII